MSDTTSASHSSPLEDTLSADLAEQATLMVTRETVCLLAWVNGRGYFPSPTRSRGSVEFLVSERSSMLNVCLFIYVYVCFIGSTSNTRKLIYQ